MAGAAVVAGAALVGIGVASVKMAGDYEQSLKKVQALTGSSNTQMAQYDTSLKSLAVDAGVAPKALADGLYNVISAGYSGADAMKVLTLATEDSKIGMTSAAVTSDALTNVMASFNAKVSDATRINGEMLQTVTLGKATFEQYATTIVKAASSAAQFHVSMQTMNAAWATMTSSGIRAAQASTDFQQSLKVMDGNIGTVTKSLNKSGIAFDETKFNAMDYGHQVVYLNAALQQANDKHVKVTGVTIQAAQAISTIAGHIDTYNSNLASLSNKQAMAQKTAEAWATTQSGFNQQMSRANAAVQVLMINIGSAFLPVLTQLMGQVAPLITQFSNWATQHHVLENAASMLKNGISGLIGIITNLVTTGVKIVTFFQQNQAALVALVSIIIGVGAAIMTYLVVAFLAWAAAMIPVVVETWALMAPFVLIGLVVAVVVFGIVMAILHWGQIVAWLRGVWSAFSSWIGGVFSALGTFIHGVLTNIAGFFTSVWNGIVNGVRTAWNWIVSAVKIGAMIVLLSILGPFIAIGALFVWLYNHNYYFKALIDAIVNFVKAGLAWMQSAWVAATGFLVALWNGMVGIASSVWSSISGAIKGAVQAVWGWLQSVWSTAVSWISTQWGRLSGLAGQAWSAVTGVFQSAWNGISGALSSLWSSISGWFNGLPSQMVRFGINAIQGFIDGVLGMLGNVGNAAGQIAGKIAASLGFHSPAKEGPGRELDEWPKNLIASYAVGLQTQIPLLQSALTNVMIPVAAALSTTNPSTAADQLSFAQPIAEIYRGTKTPQKSKAELQREAAQYKNAQSAAAGGFKSIDAEIKMLQAQEQRDMKNEQAVYAAKIKAITEQDKHLKGLAKKHGEEEIKTLRAREKEVLAQERSALAQKIKSVRAQEQQLKQEIKLELHIHAQKVDAAEIDRIAQATIKHFGNQIRAQFGNI